MKRLFYDLETTGLNPAKHSIHQLAGKIVIDGEVKETFDIKMQPNPKAQIDPEALKVAGITVETLKTYQSFQSGYLQFHKIVSKYVDQFNKKDKFHLVGYNICAFDNDFLRGLFKQNDNMYFGSYFWSDCIDVFPIACMILEEHRTSMENFKLGTVAKKFGIDVKDDKLHDGLYDIELTEQILHKINALRQ